jgi:hypothetical protein
MLVGGVRVTWTKLSDDFSDDCWRLSDAAFRLHVEGLVWANRKLVDLRLAKDDMVRWAKRPGAVDELLAAGWWRDSGDHYEIVHHGVYQRSREAILKQQEANQRNGAKGGRPKGPPRERPPRKRSPKTDSLTDSLTELPTERDGTGQAWITEPPENEESESVSANGGGWPGWRGQGSDPYQDYQ